MYIYIYMQNRSVNKPIPSTFECNKKHLKFEVMNACANSHQWQKAMLLLEETHSRGGFLGQEEIPGGSSQVS